MGNPAGSLLASALALGICLAVCGVGRGATVEELWPAQTPAGDAASLISQLDAAAKTLPAQLQPAIQFQKVFVQIIVGAPQAVWRGELERLARLTAARNDPATLAVQRLARVWLARVQMQELDAVLRKHYRNNVSFPESLAKIAKDIPPHLRTDPWGEPWMYQVHAPQGFKKQTDQRYQLGPTRLPQLTTLKQATRNRPPAPRPWKVTAREVGGTRALEFRLASTGAPVATTQAGGAVGDCVLVHVGQSWALLANQDQLFTIAL
jgi:hypothetical protein